MMSITILVVFGATGFTGELTCEYLAEIKDTVSKKKKKKKKILLVTSLPTKK
jgi:short subunit dehydrogenase-like uncharacterized protein